MTESRQDVNTVQTTTMPSAPQSTQRSSNRRLSKGAIVGITFGVILFVALLVAIGVPIYLRLKKLSTVDKRNSGIKTRSRSPRVSQIKLGKRRSESKVRREVSAKAQRQLAVPVEEEAIQFIDLDRDLPQPISERELLQDWEKLTASIKIHVSNSYHQDKTSQRQYVESSPLAYLEPYLLSNPFSRHLAIRQCIGKLIVENINPAANLDDTFLPPKLVSIIQSMPIMASEKSPLLEAALARWRVITQFLLCPKRRMVSTEYMINSDAITRAAKKLSNDLQVYLQPENIVSKEECETELEKTLRLGANFGLKLFSQGARWNFGYSQTHEGTTTNGRRSLVVLPALFKMTDENGQFLVHPIVVREEYSEDFY